MCSAETEGVRTRLATHSTDWGSRILDGSLLVCSRRETCSFAVKFHPLSAELNVELR
ncbi:hypothetical protein WN55_05155 [Dufourea novaeangliae]|uniref:Uncharacterized protein n=1 Tax=Dufourea novaeangliae TaxID=178035 RepID=A0A154PP14_DUFNO|nr:hypothetical protein WN55_05155 [Dufourea novaeangliae]